MSLEGLDMPQKKEKEKEIKEVKEVKETKKEAVSALAIAVIKTGGKQYKVKVGDVLKVEKLDQALGAKQEFEDILNGKKVTAEIVGEGKLDKVMVSKFHAKKRYERHVGHRQNYTQIKIEAIK